MKIKASYQNYHPPGNPEKSIRILLKYVPDKYLRGIDVIILRSSKDVNRATRREDFKGPKTTLGTYHHRHGNSKPYIELYIDTIIEKYGPLRKIPMVRNIAIGETLYHEIGHHIHQTIKPEYRDKERTADDWSKYFNKKLFKRRYFYMYPVLYAIHFLHKGYKKINSLLNFFY